MRARKWGNGCHRAAPGIYPFPKSANISQNDSISEALSSPFFCAYISNQFILFQPFLIFFFFLFLKFSPLQTRRRAYYLSTYTYFCTDINTYISVLFLP